MMFAALLVHGVGHASEDASHTANFEDIDTAPTQISVQGVNVLSTQSVSAVVDRYAARRLSALDRERLRIELSRLYLESGYVNSGFVFAGSAEPGARLQLVAIEGKLSRIEMTGQSRLRDAYVQDRVMRHVATPMDVDDVQYALRWLQLDRNVERLDAELLPGDSLGESVLRIEVEEPPRFDFVVGVDNHRSASLGSEAVRVAATARNLTGFGDQSLITAAVSDGVEEWSGATESPVNRWNTKLGVYFTQSNARIIEARFDDLNIESESRTLGIWVSHPLLDTLSDSLSLALTLENKTNTEELLGSPFSFSPGADNGESEVTVAQVALEWTRRTTAQVLSLRGAYRRGLDAFGATRVSANTPETRYLNPTGADSDFQIVVLQGLALLRLNEFGPFESMNERAQLIVRATFQDSSDPLMSLEKFAVGGVNTVRGFRENTLVRDNGAAVSVEAQIPVWGYRADPHPLNLVVAAFLDYGASWDEVTANQGFGSRDTAQTRHIASAGLGLIWQPVNGLRAQLYWGEPIADNFDGDDPRRIETNDYDLQDDGLHFSMTFRI